MTRHPVVRRQHPPDQRRIDGGPSRHAPQPGAGPHAGPHQRSAVTVLRFWSGTAATGRRTAHRGRTYPSSPRSRCARSKCCGTARRRNNYTDTRVTDNDQSLLDGRPLCRVRLCPAAHPLECRRHATPGAGEPARPRQLLRRLVRLRQRIRGGLLTLRGSGPGLLRRPADRRPGAEHRSRAGNDPRPRPRPERLRHLLAGVRDRDVGG